MMRQFYQARAHSGIFRGLDFVADVYLAGGVLPHDYHAEAGFASIFRFEFRDFGTDFVFYGLTDGLSVDDHSHIIQTRNALYRSYRISSRI